MRRLSGNLLVFRSWLGALVVLTAVLGIAGCGSKELSRAEAAKRIEEALQKEDKETEFVFGRVFDFIWFNWKKTSSKQYTTTATASELSKRAFVLFLTAGLIRVVDSERREDPTQSPQLHSTVYRFEFTPKAEPHVLEKNGRLGLVIYNRKDVKVTGILQQSDTTAVVDVTIRNVRTPFGEILHRDSGKEISAWGLEEYSRQYTFRRYDDGWRVQKFRAS